MKDLSASQSLNEKCHLFILLDDRSEESYGFILWPCFHWRRKHRGAEAALEASSINVAVQTGAMEELFTGLLYFCVRAATTSSREWIKIGDIFKIKYLRKKNKA